MRAYDIEKDGDSVREEKITICPTCQNIVRIDQIKERNGIIGCKYCIA